ncbi:MAG: hypothetical protein JZU58_03050 [Curvibacter lanceolatus]|uniref:hypothetical protein n=1 Tax=Curvibacter lanceolatus TaxID=86182 RepID=UPI00235265C1|nr:hypothetical protein [Curvibacter lanceolatus]MBV5291302.1 hypothetical protein [Curvibacter lanceolatus]
MLKASQLPKSAMPHTTYKGISIEFTCTEEPPGRWMPSAILTDSTTGEASTCTKPDVQNSLPDAIGVAYLEARRRINAGTWRN